MRDETVARLRELEDRLAHAPGRDTGPLSKELAEERDAAAVEENDQ